MLENKLGRQLMPGMDAAHTCRNRHCINPDHMTEKTHRDNLLDKQRDGTWGRKLTPEAVASIKTESGSFASIGRKYGVSTTMVGLIRRGLCWAHVPGQTVETDTVATS